MSDNEDSVTVDGLELNESWSSLMDSNRARGENMAAFAFVPSLFAEFVSEFVVRFVFK